MIHADFRLVLILGVFLLGAGGISMAVVRLTSPGLQGVGRFSIAFAAGMLGAGFRLLQDLHPAMEVGTDVAALGSFVLMHTAVLTVTNTRGARLWHGFALLLAQIAVDLCCLAGWAGPRLRISSLSLLIAVQAITTATALWPLLRGVLRAPAAYCVSLLVLFACTSVVRGVVRASEPSSSSWNHRLGFLAFSLYLMVELGLAFGFFWMTTANLTAEVEQVASTDPLTRVSNRRVFLQWCEKELLRSQRSGTPFSLLIVDLDHFKRVNDSFGHQRGDEVLVAAVERMQDSIRGIDVLCRWGGEEFAVLLPNATLEATLIVAERIRENISRVRIQLIQGDVERVSDDRLTASIGTATYRDVDDDTASMFERADKALYRAKLAGRNRVLIGV